MKIEGLVILIIVIVIIVIIVGRSRRGPSGNPTTPPNQCKETRFMANAGHRHGVECGCDQCISCKDGGIGSMCQDNSDCACGLACQGRQCVCPKPPPPSQVIIQLNEGNDIMLTWSPVPGADSYDVYLYNVDNEIVDANLFYENNTIVYSNLPLDNYYALVYSVSGKCGRLDQSSRSRTISTNTR